jgi:predicted aldo/keto reductase-like oxidoreductase
MKYRKFGRMDWDVSILGFGTMRLPCQGDVKNIEEREAAGMLHQAIDHGVNYIDTAYTYHGGQSERFVGRVLGGGYREKVKLATKMPSWLVNGSSDFDNFLGEQLKRLKTEHIEFYLLHNLNKQHWKKLKDLDAIGWAERAVADGKIGQLGFSFHDEFDVFKEIVDAWDWPFCQIQYNYMDVQTQAGTRGLKYAVSKGMAVVVMEPIMGGKLAAPPPPVQEVLDRDRSGRSAADWALQWLWNQPEVTVVLSGMSTSGQVVENLESANVGEVGSFAQPEMELIREARRRYKELAPIPCTRCGYCMPCPNGVDIPENLTAYNDGAMYGRLDLTRRHYGFIAEKARSTACIQCRECEPKCPQNIPISEWMPKVSEVLAEGRDYAR